MLPLVQDVTTGTGCYNWYRMLPLVQNVTTGTGSFFSCLLVDIAAASSASHSNHLCPQGDLATASRLPIGPAGLSTGLLIGPEGVCGVRGGRGYTAVSDMWSLSSSPIT